MRRLKSATWQSALFRLSLRELEDLRAYSDDLEVFLLKEANDLATRISKATAGWDDTTTRAYVEAYAEDYSQMAGLYPAYLRASHFAFCYARFEHVLVSAAEGYRDALNMTDFGSASRDTGIELARKFLKNHAGICFPDSVPEWTDILALREIRNCIAHNGGRRPNRAEKTKRIESLMAGWQGLVSWADTGELKISQDFGHRALETFESFQKAFFKSLGL